MNFNFVFIENLRNEALNVYAVDPYIFIFLYVSSYPVYYFGWYLMVRDGIKFHKKFKKNKKNIHPFDFLKDNDFLRGFFINRFGWFYPCIYILGWGRNIPNYLYVLIIGWLLISSLLFLNKAHGHIINQERCMA